MIADYTGVHLTPNFPGLESTPEHAQRSDVVKNEA
jgi:hypothetical protein